jgi:hypothetical protein
MQGEMEGFAFKKSNSLGSQFSSKTLLLELYAGTAFAQARCMW